MPVCFALVGVANLAAGTPVTAVPRIFATVRTRALAAGVTGVMVFDGAGFCIYLEGERDAVLRCYDAGEQDPRQTDIESLCHGQYSNRRYGGFSTGYAMADGLPASEQLRALDGLAALRCFLEMAPEFDLNF